MLVGSYIKPLAAPPFHPSPVLSKEPSAGLFSVALVVGLPRLAVSQSVAL